LETSLADRRDAQRHRDRRIVFETGGLLRLLVLVTGCW
jgi:hypothetical protein